MSTEVYYQLTESTTAILQASDVLHKHALSLEEVFYVQELLESHFSYDAEASRFVNKVRLLRLDFMGMCKRVGELATTTNKEFDILKVRIEEVLEELPTIKVKFFTEDESNPYSLIIKTV